MHTFDKLVYPIAHFFTCWIKMIQPYMLLYDECKLFFLYVEARSGAARARECDGTMEGCGGTYIGPRGRVGMHANGRTRRHGLDSYPSWVWGSRVRLGMTSESHLSVMEKRASV